MLVAGARPTKEVLGATQQFLNRRRRAGWGVQEFAPKKEGRGFTFAIET
jgi:hypothetical protein